jgi:tetratricopeptide (TPR) repeat protein
MKPIFPKQTDQPNTELIIAYHRGELSTAEREGVESRRKSDPVFDALFKAHLKLVAATRVSHLETKLEMLRAHQASQPQTKIAPIARTRLIARIAAAVLILILIVAAIRTLMPKEHDEIFQAHFSNQILPGKGELSGAMNIDDREAFDHYAREEYSKAAREFDKLLKTHPEEDYLLYAAASHLGAGHLNRATELLDLSRLQLPDNTQEIVFLQALLMVRRGKLVKAREFLDTQKQLFEFDEHLEKLHADLKEKS